MANPEFRISDITAREHASRVRLYECPLITSTSEIDFASRELINEFRGQEFAVLQQENWGKRHLEYNIRGYKRAYYSLMFYRTTPEIARKLNEKFALEPTVLRSMMLKIKRLPSVTSPISQERSSDSKDGHRNHQKKPEVFTPAPESEDTDRLPEMDESAHYFISYKNPAVLRTYLTELNRIVPRRTSGVVAAIQRAIREQIAISRLLAILPFSPPTGRV